MKRKIISLCLIMGLYMMLDTVFVNAEQNTLPAVSEEMIEKTEYAESPNRRLIYDTGNIINNIVPQIA